MEVHNKRVIFGSTYRIGCGSLLWMILVFKLFMIYDFSGKICYIKDFSKLT